MYDGLFIEVACIEGTHIAIHTFLSCKSEFNCYSLTTVSSSHNVLLVFSRDYRELYFYMM